MSKEEKKAKKLAKKEAKNAKKEAKLEKSNAKAKAKADKKHAKAYEKFVKETEKKNASAQAKAASSGAAFTPIAIPSSEEFQTKKEIKQEKKSQKAYAAYVKKLEKKNAKTEKKCAKKNKPFVPIAIPTYEEYLNSAAKQGHIVWTIILILLIWFFIYFIVVYTQYEYKQHQEEVVDEPGIAAVYESYSNPHEITTTPDYSIADAKIFLKQTLHDNWKNLGYSSDPSNDAIIYNNRIVNVNGGDCYMFTAGGKTYAVSVKLAACYYAHNGAYDPVGFNNTDILFPER